MVRVSVLVSDYLVLLRSSLKRLKNDCLNNIVNAERRGKRQVLIRPSSKVVVKFLSVMQRHGELPSVFCHRFFLRSITTIGAVLLPRVLCFKSPAYRLVSDNQNSVCSTIQ